jgi:copper chaperone CopZ
MVVRILECKHCGTQYRFQASGYNPNQENENQDDKHCHDCKTAIIEALQKIPVKFGYKNVPTTEVTLNQLLKWEEEHEYRAAKRGGFSLAQRVFAALYRDGEHQIIREVVGGDDDERYGRVYRYTYWPSEKENYTVVVEKRFNLITGEDVGYNIRLRMF